MRQPLLRSMKYLVVLHFIFMAVAGAYAQGTTIRGRVTGEAGEGLPGVTILQKGTTNGATTDTDGNYSLGLPASSGTLVFSFIGFETQEIAFSANQTTINIKLRTDAKALEEVVVVGYGTQKKETLSGSVTSVKGEDIIKSPVVNVSNSLTGRLPGVMAVSRSGEPGRDATTIRIRGSNTLGNNSALIVVDGIPGRSLDRIDPNSIETMTVLKDASAAIYGSQAANGVILITTKRGKSGKPQLVVNFNQGITQPTRIPKMTNSAQYATALNEVDIYRGRPARFTPEQIQKYADGSDPWGYPNTDWFDEVYKNWSSQVLANVTLSGGSEFMRYFISIGAKSQDAVYKNSATKYNQYDFRTNLDTDINKNISIGFDVVGRMEDSNFPGRGATGTIIGGLLRGKPNMPAYWPNGMPGPDIERGENPAIIATNQTGYTSDQYYVLNSNLKLNIKIPWVKGLTLTGNAALDKGFRFGKIFQKPWYLYAWDGRSRDADGTPVLVKGIKGINDPNLTQTTAKDQNILLNGLINYEKTFGSNEIKFLVGTETRTGRGDSFSAFRRYFVSTALDQLDAGGSNAMNNGGTAYQNARLNYFGRANYNFKEKYLAEFVWRVDGSYIFPEAGRFGFFPGLSVGWRLSEENFWKNNLPTISEFKLRASYGKTGNDRIDEWQYLSTYGFQTLNYVFNVSEESRMLLERRIPNPNVTWEVANQANVGFDAGFFNDRLSVTADFFDYRRSQMLWTRNASVPSSTGLILPRENIGKVTNRGFDFDVAYRGEASDLKYQVSFNGGYAKNKITFWDESPGAPEYQRSTGRPMPTDPLNPGNDLYYQSLGIFRNQAAVDAYPHWPGARPGDVIFEDVNKDGKIDANDRVRNNKTDMPTFQSGLGLNLQFRQFDFSILLQGAAGAQRYLRLEPAGDFGNYLLSDFEGRWTPDNIDAQKPRAFNRVDEYYRSQRSTYLLHNTDYIRLKNVELGYNLPAGLNSRIGLQGLRAYVSGFNLATYSPGIKDFDPEDNSQGNSSYPVQRVVNFGLSVTL
ncbi:MAG: TonB-dependent Transducer [Adhaeribacter sp.]|nr:TonB-dependent Transducer [Adhaeribacter sp.]